MILLTNLLLLLTSYLFYLLNIEAISLVIFVLFLILFFGVSFGFIPKFLLNRLQKKYKESEVALKNNNAIILLGNGLQSINGIQEPLYSSYGRLYKALEVYNLCLQKKLSCKIILSGYEAKVYAESLIKLGVNFDNIILEGKSKNTFENAKFSKDIILKHNFDNIILLSSAIHLKRANLYFKHFKISNVSCRADYSLALTKCIPLAYNFYILDKILHEYLGILRYYIDNSLGINSSKIS